MDAIFQGVLPFFAVAGIGAGLALARLVDEGAVKGLNAFVFNAGMPALLLSSLLRLDLSEGVDWRFAAAYAAGSLVHYAVTLGAARGVLRLKNADAAGLTLASTTGNTAFLMFPLTLTLFGSAAAAPGALALLIDNALLVPVGVAAIGAAAGAGGLAAAARRAFARTLRNPIVLASFAGLAGAAFGAVPPGPVMTTIDMLGRAASPAALFALGAMIALNARAGPPRVAAPAAFAVAAKLVVFPAIVFAALTLAGVDPFLRAVGVLFAAAPAAVNAFVQTTAYEVYARETAAAVAATTVASMITLSVLVTLLA